MSDAPRPSGPDRRTLFRGVASLGAGGLSLPLLAACGEQPQVDEPSTGQKIAATSDVPVGGGVILDDPGIVLTQPTEGTFKAFSPICPHQGCTVASIEGDEIDCPCHGSKFAISDGSVKQGPAQKGLEVIPVTVRGTEIVGA